MFIFAKMSSFDLPLNPRKTELLFQLQEVTPEVTLVRWREREEGRIGVNPWGELYPLHPYPDDFFSLSDDYESFPISRNIFWRKKYGIRKKKALFFSRNEMFSNCSGGHYNQELTFHLENGEEKRGSSHFFEEKNPERPFGHSISNTEIKKRENARCEAFIFLFSPQFFSRKLKTVQLQEQEAMVARGNISYMIHRIF